jgi:hypothetical protein
VRQEQHRSSKTKHAQMPADMTYIDDKSADVVAFRNSHSLRGGHACKPVQIQTSQRIAVDMSAALTDVVARLEIVAAKLEATEVGLLHCIATNGNALYIL